mgnify:CR=1 FL=1
MRKPAKLLYKGKRKLSKQALFHGCNSFTGLLVRKPNHTPLSAEPLYGTSAQLV